MKGMSWSAVLLVAAALVAVMLLIGGVFILVHRDRCLRAENHRLEGVVQAAEQARQAIGRELEAVLKLNRELVVASDERTLVEAALSTVNELVGGLGCSFVPFDAWGEPLPAFTIGSLPEPVLKGWAEHLLSEQVRSRCENCRDLYAAPGQECPLHIGPLGATMAIYCLPLGMGNRRLGLVNLYLAPGSSLDSPTQRFLQGLLDEMALAIESRRLHNQEIDTFKQIQRLRSPRAGLAQALETLLEGLRGALPIDVFRLRVRPMADERLSNLSVLSAGSELPDLPQIDLDCERTLQSMLPLAGFSPGGTAQKPYSWQVFPLLLPEGTAVGTLLVLRSGLEQLPERYQTVLQTAAVQAAMRIENERQTLQLEYNLVIQERTRLAREIHDGLAQTLAFLKMQAAQMVAALNQSDQPRLARLLQESRVALGEAYLETRQAIDNLRLNPEEGLLDWLGQSARGFERATGIPVELTFSEERFDLLPEIQVQMVRVVQEALNNIRKHAHAEKVHISMRRWSSDWILEVNDDGQGFDPEDVPLAVQYGLRGMRERADLIGAEFQITSQPRRGTSVRLFLPGQAQEVE